SGSFTLKPQRMDEHIQFNAPNVDAESGSILAFRVDPIGEVTLQVFINNKPILTQAFNTEPQRSWHEVVAPHVLKPFGNDLAVARSTDSAPGSVMVTDIVLFF